MIHLHPGQTEVFRTLFVEKTARFVATCCARGWGKSYMAAAAAIAAVFELIEMAWNVPNKTVYIIAPTYDQVTDIYFPLLMYDLGVENHVIKASRDLGRFIFPNKTELRLISYEAVERMRGKGAYFVVWDEISSCTKGIGAKEAWEAVVQPCIITRWSEKRQKRYAAPSPGRALVITTPKGYNYFYDMYNYREHDPLWASFHYDYRQSPLIDVNEVERIRHTIDPIEFASEYMADFKESGYNVFHCFDRKTHVTSEVEDFSEDEVVHACIDFNVGLQCTSFFAIRGGQNHIIDEMKGHPDTETLGIAIKQKYPNNRINAFPDPSGRARKTSAPVGTTDFTILENMGIRCLARKKAPPISDSVNAVNRQLLTAAGDVNTFIHPRCQGVIKSLERTIWTDRNPDLATIDKSEGVEHYSDGIRYGFEYLYPVNQTGSRTARGFSF